MVRWRRVGGAALAIALLAVGAYAAAGALAWNEQTATAGRGCAETGLDDKPASFAGTYGGAVRLDARRYRFDAEDVAFPSRTAGLTLRAYWRPPAAPESRTVIVVHGRNSCRHDPVVLLPAGMLARNGYGVLVVDLRDHGDSDREDGHWAAGADEWQDVLAAWDSLRAQGIPARSIGALGLSMGAGAVSLAVGREPGLAAAWLDSPYANVVTASSQVAKAGGRPEWLVPGALGMGQLISGDDFLGPSPESLFGTALDGRPVAIVHGTADTVILVEQGIALAAAATRGGSPTKPWIIEGGRHVEAAFLEPKLYERRLSAFFHDALQPAGSG